MGRFFASAGMRDPGTRAVAWAWGVLTLSTGPGVGWVIGNLSAVPSDPAWGDGPLLGRWATYEWAVGLAMTGSAVGSVLVLLRLAWRGELPPGWGLLSASTAGLAAATGAAYRVWAGPVDGVNFGGAFLVVCFPAVIATAALLAIAAVRVVRRCSYLRSAVWVSGGYLVGTSGIAVAASFTGYPPDGDRSGLAYVLFSYTFPALGIVPEAAPAFLVVAAGAAQWFLANLALAGLAAALDRPEPVPERL